MIEPSVALASLLSLGMLVALSALFRDFHEDRYRQRLFALRDEFFDEAASDRIEFDSRAYGLLRTTLNGLIRFAHRMSLIQVLLMLLLHRWSNNGYPARYARQLSDAVVGLSRDQRKMIERYTLRMNLLTLEYLFWSSVPLVVTVVLPIIFVALVRNHVTSLVKRLSGPLRKLDSTAYAIGRM